MKKSMISGKMNKEKDLKTENTSWRTLVFKFITAVIPVFILLLFEGLLRITGYGDNLDLFIQNPAKGYEKYMIVNPVIGKKYFQKLEYTSPANDIFLKIKPANCFRIFVMGSSVVYGFPYERNLMFSRILDQQLADAYPDKRIEIVNTAITAVNSYTLLDFIDEILKYDPDAILIYEGHNEFYGAFGIGSNETMSRNRMLTRLHFKLMDSRIYQLIRNIVSGSVRRLEKKEKVHGTLMRRAAANKKILLDSEDYLITMDCYRKNMGDILKKIGKKNVPAFIGEVVSNIHDMEPFCSMPGSEQEAAADIFHRAQLAEGDGDFDTALELYYKAKDLDCIRFRASEDINRITHELAKEYNVHIVPFLSLFQSHSRNKFIGNNFMTEHVHPNINGIFLMAEGYFSEIAKSGIAGELKEFPEIIPEYYMRNWGYTALDSLLAHHRIQLLKGFWPFVPENKDGTDFRTYYHPQSYPDSLAFSVLKNPGLSLADVRLDLAERYEKTGQIYEAYREYESLLRMNPYVAVNYRDAAQCLLQLSDLPFALKYFLKSLEFEDSFFATFRIGEIYLMMGDYKNASLFFEKSFALAPDDRKVNVLAKSYMAFLYGNRTGQAKAIASEIKRVGAAEYLNIPPKKYVFSDYIPYQTRDQVNQARQLIAANRTDEALELLEFSLQVYDSHIANRLIGEMYLGRQNNEKALYYLKKVYDQFKFDPHFFQTLFMLYKAGNDFTNAGKCLEEIRMIDPGFKDIDQMTLSLP